ncbi:MAG: zinc ribbon domain-containing protein [Vicinamibacterales bacterium]
MLPALASLVALQDVASRAEDARRRIADAPSRIDALNEQLNAATRALEDAKGALAASQAARRELEKEAAVAQQRVSKFKDQLMEAKDNRQYHALQHEIATFGEEVSRVEGLIIERMVEGDELTATMKAAEAALAKARQTVAAQKAAIEAEVASLTTALDGLTAEHAAIARDVPPSQLATFETLFKARKGVALARVVDGLCEACRMRVRPHLYNQIRAGDQIIQCESCQRIFYYVPPPKPDEQAAPPTS